MEMLVTAAIIAGLMALLVPSVNRALEKSRETRCLSNLRQIGQAVLLYAADHQMALPPGNRDGDEWFKLNSTSWLREYGAAGSERAATGLLRCPVDSTRAPVSDYKYYYSYTWNTHLLQAYVGGVPAHGRTPVKNFEAQRKILFVDGITHGEAPAQVAKYPPGTTSANAESRISSRHRGGANALFGDGSVQWLAKDAAINPDWYRRDQ